MLQDSMQGGLQKMVEEKLQWVLERQAGTFSRALPTKRSGWSKEIRT